MVMPDQDIVTDTNVDPVPADTQTVSTDDDLGDDVNSASEPGDPSMTEDDDEPATSATVSASVSTPIATAITQPPQLNPTAGVTTFETKSPVVGVVSNIVANPLIDSNTVVAPAPQTPEVKSVTITHTGTITIIEAEIYQAEGWVKKRIVMPIRMMAHEIAEKLANVESW